MSLRFKIYLALLLAGAIIGFYKYRKIPTYLRIVTWLFFASFISESVSRLLVYTIKNSNPVYHFYSIIEPTLIGAILISVSKKKTTRRAILFLTIGTVLFSIYNSIFVQKLYTYNSYAEFVRMPVCVFCAFLVLIEQDQKFFKEKTLFPPVLLVILAICWYNIVGYGFSLSHNYLVENGLSTKVMGSIQYFTVMSYYSIPFLVLITFRLKKDANPN